MAHAAIVGAGISGLSAAYYLTRLGHRCTLIEKRSRLGGLIRTVQAEGCRIECGPDSVLAQKPWGLELIREIGLGGELIPSNDHARRTYVLKRGRLRALPAGVQLIAPAKLAPVLFSSLLGPFSKLRIALEWFQRPPAGERPDCSVADFILRHFGRGALEYIAQPMLAGVYGGEPEELSAESLLPRFWELEQRHGSLIRALRQAAREREGRRPGPLFYSLRGGMQQLVDRLAERLKPQTRVMNASVLALEKRGEAFRVVTDAEAVEAGCVVLAAPAFESARLLAPFDDRLAGLLSGIRYTSALTAALVYERPPFDHPLDAFGLLVPRRERRRIAACTWVNTKFDHRAPPERALLRGFLTGARADEMMNEPEPRIAEAVHGELRRIMRFRGEPAAHCVDRWPRAMPQYEVGHRRRFEQIEQRMEKLPGLWLTGNFCAGVGIPDCILRGRKLAEAIGPAG